VFVGMHAHGHEHGPRDEPNVTLRRQRSGALGANALLNVHVDQGQNCSHGTGGAVEYPQ
jgi:hypothetical protein